MVKIKPLYIYLTLFTVFVISVIVFSNMGKNEETVKKGMPDDEIHKGLMEESAPSGSNVMSSAREKLEALKLKYEKNPTDTLIIREYADLLTMAHQPDKALELYVKILKVDGKRTDILTQLTYIYFNNGQLDKAEESVNRILSIDKDHLLGNYNAGAIAAAKGNNKKAEEYWEGLLKKYPGTEIAHIAEQSLANLKTAGQANQK